MSVIFIFFVLNAKLEFISSFLKQGHDMAKINLRIEQGGNYPYLKTSLIDGKKEGHQ